MTRVAIVLVFVFISTGLFGCAAMRAKKFDKAGASALVKQDPGDLIEYFYEYEEILPEEPRLTEAKLEKVLLIAARRHPKNWEFYAFRASQLERLGRHEEAVEKHEEARVWWACDEYFRKSLAQRTANIIFAGIAVALIDSAIPDDPLPFPEAPGRKTWRLAYEAGGWMMVAGTPSHEPEADCSGRLYPRTRGGGKTRATRGAGRGWDEVAAENAEYRRTNWVETPVSVPKPPPQPAVRQLRQQGEECGKDSDCDIGMMCRAYQCVTPSEWSDGQ
jgi:hypothetical protein